MPLYEYQCEECGASFEELVPQPSATMVRIVRDAVRKMFGDCFPALP